MTRKIVKYGKTDSEAKYEQVLSGCVGLGGKAHSLRKLESLGIYKNREPFYDDLLYMTSRNKTNMYKVKQPFKQNQPFVNGPQKIFGNRFVKSKIKIRSNLDEMKSYIKTSLSSKEKQKQEANTPGKL